MFNHGSVKEQLEQIDDYLSKNICALPFSMYEMFVLKNNKVYVRERVKSIVDKLYFASHPDSRYVLMSDRLNHKFITGFSVFNKQKFPKLCRALTLEAIKTNLPEEE